MIADAAQWQGATTVPSLGPEAIHLWQFSLQVAESCIDGLRSLLNPVEISRTERLIRPADRLHFIAGRARLRQLLGSYLAIEPHRLEFSYLPHGKPVLTHHSLSFNLSHSDDRALLAIARSVPLGVDLEMVRPALDWGPLASRYFSRKEQQALQKIAPQEQTAAFFTIWTRKEAWLKAVGSGFHLPFDSFDVSGPPAVPALLRHQGDPDAPRNWQMEEIPVAADCRATLAYRAPEREVSLFEFCPSES